jgi:hypothetical protein
VNSTTCINTVHKNELTLKIKYIVVFTIVSFAGDQKNMGVERNSVDLTKLKLRSKPFYKVYSLRNLKLQQATLTPHQRHKQEENVGGGYSRDVWLLFRYIGRVLE